MRRCFSGSGYRTRQQQANFRSENGISLVECMVSVVVGSILLYAAYSSTSLMYKTSTTNENQVLATNMAQQVIDNARDSTYGKLNLLCNGSAVATTVGTNSQQLDLYGYTSTFFPRPLLRNLDTNAGLTYTQASKNQAFPGTVTETLTTLQAYDGTARTGAMKVGVVVTWKDGRGTHNYKTATVISQTGIHNY
jgi:type II secretory pathway pseudopilin PulG